MKAIESKLVITNDDYNTISSYVKSVGLIADIDKNNAALLHEELKKATLVKKEDLPEDVVRLNSKVVVKEANNGKLIELILVVPERANIKERKISVLAPVGTALLGFRQGARVKWQVPAGTKTFTIVEVSNKIN